MYIHTYIHDYMICQCMHINELCSYAVMPNGCHTNDI